MFGAQDIFPTLNKSLTVIDFERAQIEHKTNYKNIGTVSTLLKV